HGAAKVIFESYETLGYNYRMTDMQAAMGRVQLGRLPNILARRRALAALYTERLTEIGVSPPFEPEWARSNWQSYCVTLPDNADQMAVMQALLDRGISTRRGVMNTHLEPAYRDQGLYRRSGDLARSEAAQARSIILPLFVQMSDDDVHYVVEELAAALAI